MDLHTFLDNDQKAYNPSDEAIINWLRTSGGPLGERIMKIRAAELIEAAST